MIQVIGTVCYSQWETDTAESIGDQQQNLT